MTRDLNVIRVPRETTEFQKLTVTEDGQTITTGLEIAITPLNDRPTTWAPLQVVEGDTGFTIDGMTPGEYNVWVRITETAVRFVGTLTIT